MTTYRTRDGDRLDRLCIDHYGQATGYVEAVLAANAELADQGPIYSSGLIITFPDLPSPLTQPTVIRLWD